MAPRPRKAAPADIAQFEAMLKELESVVARMEQGEQTLEASLDDFERGIVLTRECQSLLNQAQQRVELLSRDGSAQALPDHDEL